MLNLLGIGDNVCDMYLHTGTMYPGGQALNVAVFAGMLGANAEYMGVFGTDDVAKHVKSTLRELNVSFSHSRTVEGENGYAKVHLVNGDRVFLSSNKGGVLGTHPIRFTDEDRAYIQGFDLVYTSNNSYLDDQLPILNSFGPWLSYDFSGSWKDESRLSMVCCYTDVVLLSSPRIGREEAWSLARLINTHGENTVVITMGSAGAWCFSDGELYYQPIVQVQAIDTLGAGDSFAAQFLVCACGEARNRGIDINRLPSDIVSTALEAAADFAAKTCLVHGAFGYGAPIPLN